MLRRHHSKFRLFSWLAAIGLYVLTIMVPNAVDAEVSAPKRDTAQIRVQDCSTVTDRSVPCENLRSVDDSMSEAGVPVSIIPLRPRGTGLKYDLTKSRRIKWDQDITNPNYFERLYEAGKNYEYVSYHTRRTLQFHNSLDNPYEQVRPFDQIRIRQERENSFYNWQKSEFKGRIRNLIGGADRDSVPIRVLRKMKGLFGGGDLFSGGGGDPDKGIRPVNFSNDIHISETDWKGDEVQVVTVDQVYLRELKPYSSESEPPPIRTRLRSKLNISKREANIRLENAILNIGAFATPLNSDSPVEIRAHRSFHKAAVSSSVSYGPKFQTLTFLVTKSITRGLNCEFKSYNSKIKNSVNEESLRFSYRLNF